jgi:hypothetical protein
MLTAEHADDRTRRLKAGAFALSVMQRTSAVRILPSEHAIGPTGTLQFPRSPQAAAVEDIKCIDFL